MDRKKIEKKVIETFKSMVVKNIRPNVTLEADFRNELGIDSIQLVSMVTVFEEVLNFDTMLAIAEVEFDEIKTGNDIVDMVLKYQK
ncbi:acyl carrier protein [Butyrivibrio sp. M55]|uniref:acyl carrier protein n=1 Tax=Butyrivibrio sp. M55 TaxID=1855323 RepID=UPI0008E03E47|nr:acyl carrier protein [Butyrivibrio sp. M55]SFU54204.1 Phosphopantetheine attachment site [Butyrivibrio sp. M55]